MKQLQIALSANTGISLTLPDGIIWIDALHNKKTLSYSTITPELWEYINKDEGFIGADKMGPDIIAFTHCHTDHFSSHMTIEAHRLYPDAEIILPQNYFPWQKLLSAPVENFRLGNTKVSFIKARHSGAEKLHKSYFAAVDDGETRILIPGDTALSETLLSDFAADFHADIAIMSYTWLLFSKGRRIIDEIIRPTHLIIDHMPFDFDDTKSGIRKNALKSAAMIKCTDDVRLLYNPHQKETVIL